MSRSVTLLVIVAYCTLTACSSEEGGSDGTGGTAGSAGSAGAGGTGGSSGSGGAGGSAGNAGSSGNAGSAGSDAGVDAGPPATCEQLCAAAIAAQCSNFAVTQPECESFCATTQSGVCGAEWSALLQCAGPAPQVACNAEGDPTFAGCLDQEQAFDACEGADGG